MRTLHVIRGEAFDGGPPLELVAEHDWIVYLHPTPRLVPTHPAPVPAGPIDHDQLVALCFAADRVITW